MGTDMYMCVEECTNGYWKQVPRPERVIEYTSGTYRYSGWYIGRCYSLFSILANVRNFPRCWEDYIKVKKLNNEECKSYCGNIEMLKPISPNRGLPHDATDLTREELEDRYSLTWYTVKELQEFNWDTLAGKQDSSVNHIGYKSWKEGTLEGACGGISPSTLISHKEMEERILSGDLEGLPPNKHFTSSQYVTVVEWEESYRQAAGQELFDLLDELSTKFPETNKVRILMGFD